MVNNPKKQKTECYQNIFFFFFLLLSECKYWDHGESLSQEVSISEVSHWQLWNYSWHIHTYRIESWKSESAKYLEKLPLAPCLTQGQFYLCHSWLMFIKPINKGVPWWQLQFSPAICSVPFYIFIIKIFVVSDPYSFVLESNLITFLFYSALTWWENFFPSFSHTTRFSDMC